MKRYTLAVGSPGSSAGQVLVRETEDGRTEEIPFNIDSSFTVENDVVVLVESAPLEKY